MATYTKMNATNGLHHFVNETKDVAARAKQTSMGIILRKKLWYNFQ